MIGTLFIACTLLLALGVPVAFALGVGTLAAMLVNGNLSLLALPKTMFSGIDVFALLAVPFFILAAELMIDMRHHHRLAQFVQSTQQGHAIRTARDGDDAGAGRNFPGNFFNDAVHAWPR